MPVRSKLSSKNRPIIFPIKDLNILLISLFTDRPKGKLVLWMETIPTLFIKRADQKILYCRSTIFPVLATRLSFLPLFLFWRDSNFSSSKSLKQISSNLSLSLFLFKVSKYLPSSFPLSQNKHTHAISDAKREQNCVSLW